MMFQRAIALFEDLSKVSVELLTIVDGLSIVNMNIDNSFVVRVGFVNLGVDAWI